MKTRNAGFYRILNVWCKTLLLLITVTVGLLALQSQVHSQDEKPVTSARHVIATIEGEPIFEDELLTEVNYLEPFQPYPRAALILTSVEELMLHALLKAKYPERCAALQAEADAAWKRLQDGEDFITLCKEVTHDDGNREQGGMLGEQPIPRGQMIAPFERLLFEAEKGDLIAPFMTRFGIHIVKIEDVIEGETEKDKRVLARHILFMFDRYDPNRLMKSLAAARRSATIELVDENYADYFYIADPESADDADNK